MIIRILALLTLLAPFAASADGDLTLPGERWYSKFDRYVCNPMQEGTAVTPSELSAIDVNFLRLTTDRSLDNVLLLATFTENETTCRYSALLFADNAAQRARLLQSKAYAPDERSLCASGKALLDRLLGDVKYLYYGHPHRVALMMETADAQNICGASMNAVGVDFLVTGLKP